MECISYTQKESTHKRRDEVWLDISNHWRHRNTKREYLSLSLPFWVHICTIWAWKWLYLPIFVMSHHCWCQSWCHHDLDTLANAAQYGRHPQEGAVKVSKWSGWWFWRYKHFVSPSLFFWTMSVLTSLASMPATPVLCQAPVNVPLPTYNWNVADQMQEFWLFKCQLETWFRLCKIKAEECLDYLLHHGKGELCSYGPLGPTRWRP